MKKELAIALPLALGAPIAYGACTVSNDGDGSIAEECTTGTVSNLSTPVDLQASAGVMLQAEDDTPNTGAVGVSTCHTSGSAYFYSDTDGGSVQKTNPDSFSCDGPITYSTASSSST